MSANTQNASAPVSEDIDLFLLLERSLVFFRIYRIVFIIGILAGIGLGVFSYFIFPKTYTSRLIAHSSVLTNQEQIQIIDTWNKLIHKQEYTAVAKAFNCSESLLHKLKKIEGTEIQKIFSTTNPNGFYIDVTITDNSILDQLQNGIVYALNNGEYVKQRLDFKKARLRELINKLDIETVKLDSTKNEMENIIQGKEKPSSSLIIDGSTANRQLIDMTERLLYLQEELNFTHGIEVLQGFNKFNKPAGRTLPVSIILGLILCLPVAYVYALVSSIKKGLKARRIVNENS
ncbi:MAG TPA: hypothetical protein VET23_13880 [Chitinophagaceae bacterium]|nr:hypothetical protein [Chitinophagaceae bacterium]